MSRENVQMYKYEGTFNARERRNKRNEDSIDAFFRNVPYLSVCTPVCRCFVSVQHVGRERGGISRRIYNHANERNMAQRVPTISRDDVPRRYRRFISYRLSPIIVSPVFRSIVT